MDGIVYENNHPPRLFVTPPRPHQRRMPPRDTDGLKSPVHATFDTFDSQNPGRIAYGLGDSRMHSISGPRIKCDVDIPDRHELFLLGDGERKVVMETVTQVANAALFTFNKEDHTLANLLRDKLFRSEHVIFSAYKVPHPLFATFELRVHTDGEVTPKAAVIKACSELIAELQELDQEFTKEFELKKMAANVPTGGLDI